MLGTGLGPLAEAVKDAVVIPYGELPGFPKAGVSGHAGRLVVGRLEGRRVAIMQGRVHTYEHGDPRAMKPAIDAFAALGVKALLLTNSAGSLKPDMPPGMKRMNPTSNPLTACVMRLRSSSRCSRNVIRPSPGSSSPSYGE